MSAEDGILFKSLCIGNLTLPGRVIKATTSETRTDKDGFATQEKWGQAWLIGRRNGVRLG